MKIYLKRGHELLIDDADYALCNYGRSLFVKENGFVVRSERVTKNFCRHIYIHKLIMGVDRNMQVDHINGNRLDNRRCNLRICTHAENQRNKPQRKDRKTNHTPFKGITLVDGRWRARCVLDGVTYSAGRFFDHPEEAAHAYDELAKKYHGEFARLNFP